MPVLTPDIKICCQGTEILYGNSNVVSCVRFEKGATWLVSLCEVTGSAQGSCSRKAGSPHLHHGSFKVRCFAVLSFSCEGRLQQGHTASERILPSNDAETYAERVEDSAWRRRR